jgi:hypothetical protein
MSGLISAIATGLAGGTQALADVSKINLEKKVKIDIAKELSDMEEQKLLRVDEVKRDRDLADIPKRGDAETNVMVDREGKMRSEREETAKYEARGRAEGERIGLAGYANDPKAREGARAKVADALDPNTGFSYQTQKDGTIAVVKGSKVIDYLKDPTTGEKLKGKTEVDSKTAYVVQMLLLELKDPVTTDARKQAIRGEINTLLGVTKSTSPTPPPAGASGNKPWNKNYGNTSDTTSP